MRGDQELIQTLRQLAQQDGSQEYSAFLCKVAYRLEQLSEQAARQAATSPSEPV